MKILYVYYAVAIFGGIERVLVDKMNMLANMGYDVFLLTANQGNHPIPFDLAKEIHYEDMNVQTHIQYKYNGLRRYWEHFRRSVLLCKRLSDKIREIRPDIIITSLNGYISELVKLKGTTPLIVEVHTGYDYVMEDVTTFLRRMMLKNLHRNMHKADMIVVLTDDDAKKWKQHYSRVCVIPNVVHLNVTGIFSTCENKRVVFVGRNNKLKGIPDLLKIWELVHQRHPDWQLDMYVERDITQLREDVRKLNANVNIYPPVSNIMERYMDSSLLVSTSIYESFSLVIAEAMSCGLPVVSFESDGPCSIVTDGYDGFLVKDRNMEYFAERVCQLIEDENLRMKMGKSAVMSAQRFSADHVLQKWIELFDSFKSYSTSL